MERKIEFDILKGILIIFVVTGHIGVNVGFDVYWFHMPAFFMISGYLTQKFISLNDIKSLMITIRNHEKEPTKNTFNKFKKFIIPYFTYCIIFFLIYRPENILKNIARVLYAGGYNVTIYSFPYWFINALMMGLLFYGTIRKYKYKILFLLAIYTIIHTPIFHLLPIPLPWGVDEGFGALIFIALGDYIKKFNLSDKRLYCIILLPIVFILMEHGHILTYKLDMKSMWFNNYLLDIIIPVSFTYLFFLISKGIAKIPYIKNLFLQLGLCCMTIYYTHAAFLWSYRELGIRNHLILTILIALTGICLHYIFRSNKKLSYLFLGK